MANHTVITSEQSNDKVKLNIKRLSLAETALYEISCLSNVARALDPEGEDLPQVLPGMMYRIRTLSNAVSQLLSSGLFNKDDAYRALEVIRGGFPSLEEIGELVEIVEPLTSAPHDAFASGNKA